MNKRIQQLKQQATTRKFDGTGTDIGKLVLDEQKFAELIVRECMSMCKTAVGNRDYNTGRMHCYDNIKQHFGVEE